MNEKLKAKIEMILSLLPLIFPDVWERVSVALHKQLPSKGVPKSGYRVNQDLSSTVWTEALDFEGANAEEVWAELDTPDVNETLHKVLHYALCLGAVRLQAPWKYHERERCLYVEADKAQDKAPAYPAVEEVAKALLTLSKLVTASGADELLSGVRPGMPEEAAHEAARELLEQAHAGPVDVDDPGAARGGFFGNN